MENNTALFKKWLRTKNNVKFLVLREHLGISPANLAHILHRLTGQTNFQDEQSFSTDYILRNFIRMEELSPTPFFHYKLPPRIQKKELDARGKDSLRRKVMMQNKNEREQSKRLRFNHPLCLSI